MSSAKYRYGLREISLGVPLNTFGGSAEYRYGFREISLGFHEISLGVPRNLIRVSAKNIK
jgi:hypothetical protein